MKNILVIGSMNMDLSIEVDHMPRLGETMVGSGFACAPGGKGANQAIAVSRLGGNVKFLGAVGEDMYGKQLVENLGRNNIAYEGATLAGVSTGIAMITVCGGNNFILLDGGANDKVLPELIERKKALFDWADYVVMQLEIPIETVLHAARLAKECGGVVILNPAPFKELPEEIYPCIDYLVPNEHEAAALVGFPLETEADCIKAMEQLRAKGVANTIITLGDKGCAYYDEGEVIFHPAEKADVVDTTAAGDSFIGGICNMLAEGYPLKESIAYATKVSAVTVSRRGAADSIPYAQEVAKR